MINYYDRAKAPSEIFNPLVCKDILFVHYDCPLESNKQDKWSQHDYILYNLSGEKP